MSFMLGRIGRSLFVVLSLSIFTLFLAVPSLTRPTWAAQHEETPTNLVEGAKKEGKLVLYSTSSMEVGMKMLAVFREKYPFMQTDLYRSGSASLLTKLSAEVHSEKNFADVVILPGGESMTLKKKGFYTQYVSPQNKFLPKGFTDPEGHWAVVYMALNGLVYNTRLVSSQEAPRSWQDLLHPKWKGKIGIDTKSFEWFGYMQKALGQKAGMEYMEKLAAQNPKFYSMRTLVAQLVTAGEVSIGLVYRGDVQLRKDKGAPLDWVGIEPIIPSVLLIGSSARAPHPHAAKLFIDLALSREGQEEWTRVYRDPSRPDVQPRGLTKALRISTPDFTIIDNYEKYGKLYREILMKK